MATVTHTQRTNNLIVFFMLPSLIFQEFWKIKSKARLTALGNGSFYPLLLYSFICQIILFFTSSCNGKCYDFDFEAMLPHRAQICFLEDLWEWNGRTDFFWWIFVVGYSGAVRKGDVLSGLDLCKYPLSPPSAPSCQTLLVALPTSAQFLGVGIVIPNQ